MMQVTPRLTCESCGAEFWSPWSKIAPKLCRKCDKIRPIPIDPSKFTSFSPEACYWLGLLATDGWVSGSTGSYRMGIGFNPCDVEHIENFKVFLGVRNKIHVDRTRAMLLFSDPPLHHFLTNLGITPCKSLTLNITNQTLVTSTDFWRGAVDGDGSINSLPRKHVRLSSSSLLFINSWKKFCDDSTGANNKISVCYPSKNPHYHYGLSGKEAINLVKLLYEDKRISLKRKQEKAEALMAIAK
jgi:hypothetical protein